MHIQNNSLYIKCYYSSNIVIKNKANTIILRYRLTTSFIKAIPVWPFNTKLSKNPPYHPLMNTFRLVEPIYLSETKVYRRRDIFSMSIP